MAKTSPTVAAMASATARPVRFMKCLLRLRRLLPADLTAASHGRDPVTAAVATCEEKRERHHAGQTARRDAAARLDVPTGNADCSHANSKCPATSVHRFLIADFLTDLRRT